MNINRHHYLTILILISLILFSFPQTLLSQEARPTGSSGRERLAVISKYKGQVKVEHDTVWKTVTKIGNRIRNSSVYNDDTVLTMPVSMADLIFNDNTHLEVQEDTSLTISTRHITKEERAQEGFIRKVAGTQKEVVRNINLKIGELWASITPSKSVLTEFETPTGVASVRGTILSLTYDGLNTILEVIEGLTEFNIKANKVLFEVESGGKANVSVPEPGRMSIGVEKGKATLETGGGKVSIPKSGFLSAKKDPDTGETTVTGIKGDVTITTLDGTTTKLEKGASLGTTTDSGTVYGAQILGGGGGLEGVDFGPDEEGKGDFGVLNDFNAGIISQDNQTQQESSNRPPPNRPPPNGGFSDDFSSGLGEWSWLDNVSISTNFGSNIGPKTSSDGEFAIVHTGKGSADQSGNLGRQFDFEEAGNRQFIFDYNFVTGEYPARVDSGFNDEFRAELHTSDGETHELAHEDVDNSSFTPVSGLPTDMLDVSSGGQTGWLSASWTGFVPSGDTWLHFHVQDTPLSDKVFDSAVLIDNVSTDFLLTFARAIGDIDSHDMDDPGIAVSNLTSIIHSDNDFAVNLDAIRDSLVVVKEFMENHINDFGDAINHNEIKAQLDSLVAKIDAARENTGDISTLRSEIETVLSIIGGHIAHCKEISVNCENLHHL